MQYRVQRQRSFKIETIICLLPTESNLINVGGNICGKGKTKQNIIISTMYKSFFVLWFKSLEIGGCMQEIKYIGQSEH